MKEKKSEQIQKLENIVNYIAAAQYMLDYLKELKDKYEKIENQPKLYNLTDGSYSLSFNKFHPDQEPEKNTLLYYTGNVVSEGIVGTNSKNFVYEIVATDCKLPANDFFRNDPDFKNKINDTIIRNVETGEMIFTQFRFLREV